MVVGEIKGEGKRVVVFAVEGGRVLSSYYGCRAYGGYRGIKNEAKGLTFS